jgi:hypothetical protein
MSVLGSTPFKIHDENSTIGSVTKSTAKKGLGKNDNFHSVVKKSVVKKGLTTPVATKSQRKALGELSNAKLNTQNRTQMKGGNNESIMKSGKSGYKSRDMMSNSLGMLSFKLASDEPLNNVEGFDEDMICTTTTKDLDPYDLTAKKAKDINVLLAPSVGLSSYEYGQDVEQDWDKQFAMKQSGYSDYNDDPLYAGGEHTNSGFELPDEEPDFD